MLSMQEAMSAAYATTRPEVQARNEGDHPLFVQVDFGLVRGEEGRVEPRLVELQAFASLNGLQRELADQYRESWGLPSEVRTFIGDLDDAGYDALVRRAVGGAHDPDVVF